MNQLSIGGILPSGSIFTLFIFSRSALSVNMAEGISVIAPVMQMAFKQFDDDRQYWS